MSIHVVADFVHWLSEAISVIAPLVLAFAAAAVNASKSLMLSLRASNWPFCAYAALAFVMVLKAYIAVRERKLEHARDHALHGLASALLALVHMFG
jgi:hypothetical protein